MASKRKYTAAYVGGEPVVVGGLEFPVGVDELHANLWMFGKSSEREHGTTPEKRLGYLRRAVDLAFNCQGSFRRVVWNRWTDQILEDLVWDWRNVRVGALAGSSSSGKSDTVALYGCMEYWARPTDTWFFVLSTTKDGARGRIWKSVTQYWSQMERMGAPGKLNDSIGFLKGVNQAGEVHGNSGIKLLAAGKQDADNACANLIGQKNPNTIVAADEATELGEQVFKTVYLNNSVNERCSYTAMANPNTLTDPFAEVAEPKNGWKSIDESCYKWETKYGWCRRLNAEESPRMEEEATFTEEDWENGRLPKCFWQPGREYCARIEENMGGKRSRGYYRFVKAFWCPDGASNTIYSEVEFLQGMALEKTEPRWDGEPVTLTALDPSFSRNGDRSACAIGKVGKVDGRTHMHICDERSLEEDINDKKKPLSHQIIRQWKQLAEDWGIKPGRAIFDNTGAGISFGHIVDAEWSPAVQKVNFQGSPTRDKVIFRGNDEEYYNKNSELWIQPKEYFRANQVSGLSKETMAELVEREYHHKESKKLRVESKEDVKKRTKKSPDRADAVLMLFEKAITLGLLESEEIKQVSKMSNNGWMRVRRVRALSTTSGRKMKGMRQIA